MTTITIKKSHKVAQNHNSMFSGACLLKTRAKARNIASQMKANGFKVLNPINTGNGWKKPHKGGILTLNKEAI